MTVSSGEGVPAWNHGGSDLPVVRVVLCAVGPAPPLLPLATLAERSFFTKAVNQNVDAADRQRLDRAEAPNRVHRRPLIVPALPAGAPAWTLPEAQGGHRSSPDRAGHHRSRVRCRPRRLGGQSQWTSCPASTYPNTVTVSSATTPGTPTSFRAATIVASCSDSQGRISTHSIQS